MSDRPNFRWLCCFVLSSLLLGCPGDDDDVSDDDDQGDDDTSAAGFTAGEVDDLEASSYAALIAVEQYALLADMVGHTGINGVLTGLDGGLEPGGLALPDGDCPEASFSLGEGIVLDYGEGCTNFRGQQIEGQLVLSRADEGIGVEVEFQGYVRNAHVAFTGSAVLSVGDRAGLSFIGSGPLDVSSFSLVHALDSSTPYPGSQILGPHDGPIGGLQVPSVGPTASGDGDNVGSYGVAVITRDGNSVWIIVPEGTLDHGVGAPDSCRCPDGGVLAQYHEEREHWTAITFYDSCGFELWINAAGTEEVGTFGGDELPQLKALLCDPLES